MDPYPTISRLTPLHPAWHAARHAPHDEHDTLVVLYELAEVIAETPERITEPSVAAMKLNWWREEIERLAAGEARHPLCKRLADCGPAAGRLAKLADFVDAQELLLRATPPADRDALMAQADRFAVIEQLAARVCGGTDDDAGMARDTGRFRFLVETLNRIGAPLRRGRCPLLIEGAGGARELLDLTDADFVQRLAPSLALADHLAATPPSRRPALRPARALHAQARALYKTIRDDPAACRQRRTMLTPLALFWHGWKGVLLAK